MTGISSQCITCKHWRGEFQCDAFPDRIPQEILSGDFDHEAENFPGDQGIKWSPLPNVASGVQPVR